MGRLTIVVDAGTEGHASRRERTLVADYTQSFFKIEKNHVLDYHGCSYETEGIQCRKESKQMQKEPGRVRRAC